MGLEPAELARWTRFAAKGGIGKCTATCDCVAESTDDLMFLKDDEIIVLLQLQDKEGCYLGYCEGVVGRFSGSDVVFHSKLKKAVMTKRASTSTTLSVHSISHVPYSPTPTTPTTPTSMESSATRPPSRKVTEELLTVGGGGRSPSQSSLGHVSPSNSTTSSPIPGGVPQSASSVGARNTSQDARKTGGLQYGPTSPRGFHLGISATDDVGEEDSAAESHSPKVGVSVDEMSPTLSSSIILTSPSTPPPVSLGLEPLPPSPPIGKEDVSVSLRPPGSLVNDHTPTAPLRIVKRSPSNPTSPAQSAFSLATTGSTSGSPNASSDVFTQSDSSDSSLAATSHSSGDMEGKTEPVAPLELQVSSEVDRRESVSAVQSSLDTSAIAGSTYDDLTTSHPGRFSRFSVADALTIPQLLGMSSLNTPHPISVKNEPQGDSAPSSPQTTIPSKLDGRTSLSMAARGKVDEATLASTQAQVGIGLSLLQDLVGGMSSDSDSEYGESDDEVPTEEGKVVRVGRTSRSTENGHLVGKAGNSTRSSMTPSEGSTTQGLTYADEEEEPQTTDHPNKEKHSSASSKANSPTSPTLPSARSPPTTPVRHQSPRSPSRYTQLQQSPESFTLPDALSRERERRPSLATSVVSGVSGLSRKSGTSGSSWDGDIYDNYRYSTFSAGSSMTGVARPSMDSVRSRTDSASVAGRIRLGSIGHIQDVAEDPEEMESADLTGVENQSTHIVDTTNASFYSQDSNLSTLSKAITTLPSNDPVSRQSATVNRPLPLSIPTLDENAHHSPLLHTDWASPTSPPASTVQTALSPPTATLYTPHLRQNTATGVPKLEISEVGDNRTGHGEQQATGMASIMRKRLEANRQSNEHSSEKEEIDGSVSFTSAGLGQDIVVDDDEELPSRIMANFGDDSELCDNDDTFLESHEGDITGSFVGPPNPKDVEQRPVLESPSPRTSIGRLAPLFVSNRTPSPAMLSKDDDDTFNSTRSRISNSPSPPRRVLSPPSQRLSPPSSLSQRQLPSESNTPQLRPRNNIKQERQSLFLPHPNAPKAPANAPLILEPRPGVGVVSRGSPTSPRDETPGGVPPSIPPSYSWPPVQAVIRMALSMPPRTALLGPGKSPVQILPTIYGRTEVDLASAVRPIPIIFSIEPLPLEPGRGKATAPRGAVLPQIGAGGPKLNRPTFPGSPPRRPSTQPIASRGPPLLVNSVPRAIVPPPPSLVSEGKEKPTMDNPVAEKAETIVDAVKLKTPPPNGPPPIPRPNFTPKAPGLRPRSRSFSGFNSSATPPPSTSRKHESIKDWPKRSASSSALPPLGPKQPAKPTRPSPLSVSSVNSSGDLSQPPPSPLILGSAPTSPLARNTFIPSSPPSTTVPAPSFTATDRPPLNVKASRPTLTIEPQPGTTEVPAAALRSTNMIVNPQTAPTSVSGSRPSFEGTAKQAPFSPVTGVARQSSLRSMISLPNLRRNRTRDDDDSVGVYDRDTNERRSDRQKEMVQVKDTEFELVRPNLSLLQTQPRTSEDSVIGRPENPAESRVVDGGLLRSESPAAASMNSSDYRSPVIEFPNTTNGSGSKLDASLGQSNESIEAHRQRETKWISLMSSSPASLSRKSKKVKKLLVDGVPSSVRYLIWSYLTDGKGRAVKGVYEQLCQRGRVIRTRDIVADAERLFGPGTGSDGIQYLQATKGAIIVLLQAYFSMVPDIQYTTGLTKIVGQLLLLAPEEDAFWIFTSIMDTHIRPYFTIPGTISSSASTPIPRSTQMEVDAALYSRALESIDPAVAKKIFVDLGILPGALCHSWFTSLFVGTLPPDCVNRVWDIFLYEGIPFLLRVALSLTIICRKFVLSATPNSESKVLATLARPPPQWLPPTSDGFLALAFGVKLKDDDIRKQRIKMGEQVKRQTQAQQVMSSVTLSGISLPSRV